MISWFWILSFSRRRISIISFVLIASSLCEHSVEELISLFFVALLEYLIFWLFIVLPKQLHTHFILQRRRSRLSLLSFIRSLKTFLFNLPKSFSNYFDNFIINECLLFIITTAVTVILFNQPIVIFIQLIIVWLFTCF